MALTLEEIMKESGILHKIKLKAGKEGMKNIVEWVHIIEDDEVTEFLHGNELVFLTGIGRVGKPLLPFIKGLNNNGISGVVINIGPYIKEIPNNVIEYCNDVNLPLFSVPWEVKLVDVTREFCRKIVKSEQIEENLVSTIKNIIFDKGDILEYKPFLERKCFLSHSQYTFIAITNKDSTKDITNDGKLKFYIEKNIIWIRETAISFSYKKYRIILLCDYTVDEIKLIISNLKRQYLNVGDNKYAIGVSSMESGYNSIPIIFTRAIDTVDICMKKDCETMWYDDLGAYKILLDVKNKGTLEEFYNEILKPIEKYDSENDCNYKEFLRIYLEGNGSVQAIADKLFVHRNTVNYQINKIKKITGKDLTDLRVKFEFLLCFYIKDIL
ncbi:MAG: PucR family transcriptional regulator [Clostridiales bacterium]|nr:PucR family transcriptional regulator [Clostridiales bacterium]